MKKIFIPIFLLITVSLSAQTYLEPEILYYKFSNNGPSNTPNYAIPGAGTNPASVLGHLIGPGGEFDSALVGTGGNGATNYLNTGWVMDLGQSSWTISFWISNYPASTFAYIMGNDISTSFRCFSAGAVGSGNITLRGLNQTVLRNIDITGVLPGPSVIHIVYDSATSVVTTYVNGVYQDTTVQPQLNLTSAVAFKVGGYNSSVNNSLPSGALMDEFRFYRRALDSTEIKDTWNQTLPYTVTSVHQQSGIADDYRLMQNYPNPFNPETRIDFSILRSGYVNLKVYNSLGQEVSTLVNKELSAGNFSVNFNGAGYSTGVYYYTLITDGFTETKKMLFVK
ncbi:MAG: T9SS type A sorting domain-containing protein [Ignavibacteriae bacterium]|nr:T9SS type A sorting domain-containing protein [Ignavibacteriota bacterium]MCB9243794.1 T9SS type A sorting domain-containing protein [Ignavibacteriales bacterium]